MNKSKIKVNSMKNVGIIFYLFQQTKVAAAVTKVSRF